MTTDGIQVVETSDIEEAIREGGEKPLPAALPVLPLKEMVAYPDTLTPLAVGQERSVKLIDDVLSGERTLVMVASRDPEIEEPGPDQLHDVGVAGVVARMLKVPDGSIRILVQATERVRLGEFIAEQPYLVARIEQLPDQIEPSPELEALTRNVQRTFSEIIEQIPYLPEELQLAVTNIEDPSALSHLIAGALRISVAEKQELLEETDVTRRLRRLSEVLARELEVIQLGSQIQSQVESEMEKGQREYYLREQLKAIQRELGEEDETQAEVTELRERIAAAQLPEHAQKAADRELSRLERLPAAAAEYGVIRTYLEWLVELPWAVTTTDDLDIGHAREVLDADHYDLEKVKERILEYLAVRSLTDQAAASSASLPGAAGGRGPILCFVGPPGVGKTSLGRSIARALGREFERISVGGVRDEAEIRGHRRTYIGAMPGTIIRAAARRRQPQPRVHDRRDRQDGRRLSRRPLERDAGGSRPGAERRLPRPLPRPPLRPLRGDVHRHREQPRHDPAAAARPDGGDPARRLHLRREAAHREALPGAAPAGRERPQAIPGLVHRRGAARDHRRVHARGGRPQPRARDRLGLPQDRPRGRRGQDQGQAERLGEAGPRAARPPASSSPRPGGEPRSPVSPPGSPGRRSAARCCSSRRPRCPVPAS